MTSGQGSECSHTDTVPTDVRAYGQGSGRFSGPLRTICTDLDVLQQGLYVSVTPEAHTNESNYWLYRR